MRSFMMKSDAQCFAGLEVSLCHIDFSLVGVPCARAICVSHMQLLMLFMRVDCRQADRSAIMPGQRIQSRKSSSISGRHNKESHATYL